MIFQRTPGLIGKSLAVPWAAIPRSGLRRSAGFAWARTKTRWPIPGQSLANRQVPLRIDLNLLAIRRQPGARRRSSACGLNRRPVDCGASARRGCPLGGRCPTRGQDRHFARGIGSDSTVTPISTLISQMHASLPHARAIDLRNIRGNLLCFPKELLHIQTLPHRVPLSYPDHATP